MLYYKDREWHICKEKVKYIQHGEEIEQYVGSEGKDWWLEFEELHDHTKIIEFTLVEPTQEQLQRLEEIKFVGEGFGSLCSDYVEHGILPDSINNPLWDLRIKKEQELQDGYLLDLDFRQSMIELGV